MNADSRTLRFFSQFAFFLIFWLYFPNSSSLLRFFFSGFCAARECATCVFKNQIWIIIIIWHRFNQMKAYYNVSSLIHWVNEMMIGILLSLASYFCCCIYCCCCGYSRPVVNLRSNFLFLLLWLCTHFTMYFSTYINI